MLNKILLSTAYLAPIQYYAILIKHSDVQIEYHENFIKQSIRNRCNIYGANGKIRLTIPLKRKQRSKTLIKDIRICHKDNWQKKHWKTIQSAYNSSPFFKYYENELYPCFKYQEEYLVVFNTKLQNVILNLLYEKRKINISLKYENNIKYNDFRNHNWEKKKHNKYQQVFSEKYGFIQNLSILDLLCNLGNESTQYLQKIII